MTARRVGWLCCILVLIAGCSVARTLYERADWWVQWNLRQYISWEPDQRAEVGQRLDRALAWHRETQLPAYRDALLELRTDLARTEPGHMDWQPHIDRGAVFWRELMLRLQPDVVAVLGTLSEAQVEELLDNIEAQAERRARRADDDAEARARRLRRQVERWTGRLDADQRQLILDWAVAQEDLSDWSRRSQARWREALGEALAQRRTDPVAFADGVERLMLRPDDLWDPEYAAAIAANTERSLELLDALHISLDARQRDRLDRRLKEWAELFDDLARG